jgi:2-amino-4-hydroxy-6-hydroxymethyldihydropteridine diphosphokinase
MIAVALGSNLPSARQGSPLATLEWALLRLRASGLTIEAQSPWYASAPVPPSGQPWFINGVARLAAAASPGRLLALLHEIEAAAGRRRAEANAARPLDLDLIDFDGRISLPGAWPVLPHPRLAARAFVLLPLADVAPGWRHPLTGQGLAELMAALPPDQLCRPLQGCGHGL